MSCNFHVLLQRGLDGEALVREWAKIEGYIVLPAGLIARGGAPALENHLRGDVVASDILASRDGKPEWIEVKTFQRATFNQRRHRWEHGVPQHLWRQYREGEALTGIPGSLAILQVDQRVILKAALCELEIGAHFQNGAERTPPSGRQVFFDVRRFERFEIPVALLDSVPEDLAPQTVRPWENREQPTDRQGILL